MKKEHKLLRLRISWVFPFLIVFVVTVSISFSWKTTTSYESLVVSDVELSDTELNLRLDCTDSTSFFKWKRYEIIGDTLYLEVGSGPELVPVLVCRCPVLVHIENPNMKRVTSVYLRDGTAAKLIAINWQKGRTPPDGGVLPLGKKAPA